MSNKNQENWQKLFAEYSILEQINLQGKFEITATQINKFREARLMTKFDFKSSLPKIFQENNLAILPITRGTYIIAPFEAYHKFEIQKATNDITVLEFPQYLRSINHKDITSETTAINCAYICGILQDFIQDENNANQQLDEVIPLLPTVNGRMSSDSFSFDIHSTKDSGLLSVNINSSQIEIDAGYENLETFIIIEAKNNIIAEDFLIRQLYYPFRKWHQLLNKKIKNIFLNYSNNIFYLREYVFEDINNYNSLKLVKYKKYTIDKLDIEINDINEILNKVKIINEPQSIPFPQANSFARVINLCELLLNNNIDEEIFLTSEEITQNYDFASRQTQYYTDAGIYLGLVVKKGIGKYALSELGKDIFTNLSSRQKQLKLVELILQHSIFKETLKVYFKNFTQPSKQEIVNIMINNNLNLSRDTMERRASSVIGWITWIVNLIS